jgi:uncharacterized protein (DUF302 family)
MNSSAGSENSMFYIAESDKSFYEATVDLEAVLPRLGFAILHAHDLSAVFRGKGIEFDDDCKIYEICSYRQLEKMLAIDMRLGTALPWRISVFTDNGATRIGLLRPAHLLSLLSGNAELSRLAREFEEKAIQAVDETR